MKHDLFLFPFAGGMAQYYLQWKRFISPDINFIPVELPGRGKLSSRPLISSFTEMVTFCTEHILGTSKTGSIVLYGHSLGSILAYDVAKRLETKHYKVPRAIFLSGHNPPHVEKEEKVSQLNDQDFVNKLRQYGGISEEVVNNGELLEYVLPIIRSDIKALENRRAAPLYPLSAKLFYFESSEDSEISSEHTALWSKYTRAGFKNFNFPGDHFFINDHYKKIVEIINETVR